MSLKFDGILPGFRNSYHFQACPKYRRGIFTAPIAKRMEELLEEKCRELGFVLHASTVDTDHFHFKRQKGKSFRLN